jgi:tetratricopeptide (TPR) repeat protein
MLALGVVIAATLSVCKKNKQPVAPSPAPAVSSEAPAAALPLARQLAAARLDAAKICIANNARDQALALLVSAFKVDPTFTEAAARIQQVLAETVWHIPIATIKHPWPVEQLAFGPPSSLWVGLAEGGVEGFNTSVLWNTEALKIDSMLFPTRDTTTRSLVVGQNQHSLVIQRGSGASAVTLLCDAKSLRPVCDLGPLPDDLTPQSVVVSTADGLLLAHPGPASASDLRLVWRVRDAATGEIVSSSDPLAADALRPLAAQLDSQRLRVLHADASLLDLPISPVESSRRYPAATRLALRHAHFDPDGAGFLALLDRGPAQAPARRFYQITAPPGDTAPRIEPAAYTNSHEPADVPWWVAGLPWSPQPSVWSGLLRDHGNPDDPVPIRILGTELRFCNSPQAPIHSESPITAAAFAPGLGIIGTASGGVFMHRSLSLPAGRAHPQAPGQIDPAALGMLAEVLSGARFDEATRACLHLSAVQRLYLLEKLQPGIAATILPGLDFSVTLAEIKAAIPREAPARALLPLWDRVARADRSAKSWPRLLELARPLADTRWHQDLTEALALRANTLAPNPAVRVDDPSPWLAQIRVREAFGKRDGAAILREIQAAGGKGPAAATALALALDADSPEWIEACLNSASGLPRLLRLLGDSRMAWLQRRMADAISIWPDEFPDYGKIRLTEDWDGWEQEDFLPRYEAHLQVIKNALAGYEISATATADERAALAARLLEPATRGIIGRRRLADNCLNAALALADFPENSAATFQLANRARSLGAQPEPCLRAEALSLTRLGDYKKAHPCWVTLLTEHPVASHLSSDYAEAAYTAFENGDPNQAMEILTTGINRFPNDSNFALRAGWIALLTGNAGRAYQFLLAGLRVGFPDDKAENANLLLAVAAAQAGYPEDATTHYQNLLEIAPAWAATETIDALEWPEELKASLYGLSLGAD